MTRAKTQWVDSPPPAKRGPAPKHDWDTIVAELREHPGEWALKLVDAPVSTANAITQRAMTALQLDDGVVRVQRRNSRTDPDTKRRYADLWLSFVPNEEE